MRRVVILGAGGRDFHNFNVVFRENPDYEVVAFTATQIPGIAGRRYPPELAGPRYPDGIPILPEEELPRLLEEQGVTDVVFAYSDVSHEHVMHCASIALAGGANFWLLGPRETMLRARRPVVAIGAVRTGAGKSPTTERVSEILRDLGKQVVILRHPMAYGDLAAQRVQRFASPEDLDRTALTVEEREEFERHVRRGFVVYAGVDYEEILRRAEEEAEILIWDGGNNDFPFVAPDLFLVVADPLRAGQEVRSHPGEACLRMADVVILSKLDTASFEQAEKVRQNIRAANPEAVLVEAAMPFQMEPRLDLRGRRVLVIEDGPTVTHGDMPYGAGYLAARKAGAQIVAPRPLLPDRLAREIGHFRSPDFVLPAMGYTTEELREMEEVIQRSQCEIVIAATPVDLGRLLRLERPVVRVRYRLQELGEPTLRDVLTAWLAEVSAPAAS